MTISKKPAMGECQGCHYRFPKPEMKKVITTVGGGYTPPRTTTRLNKNLQPTGYSKSQGTYRQGREKILWFCPECYEKRKSEGDLAWGCIIRALLIFLAGFIVVSIFFSIVEDRKSENKEPEIQALPAVSSELSKSEIDSQVPSGEDLNSLDGNDPALEQSPPAQPNSASDPEFAEDADAPRIGAQSSPGGVRTSRVIALRAAVVAAITSGESQDWNHYAESGSVIVQGIDPSTKCPILYFTVNEEGWRSTPVPVCSGQSIVD